jgi:hypothetical protein
LERLILKNVLHASLSPAEEIALRRVANGAPSIEGAAKAKLLALVLIESTRRGWHLGTTSIGTS